MNATTSATAIRAPTANRVSVWEKEGTEWVSFI